MTLRKLKQESPGKILQKAEDSRSEGGLARLAHVNYVIEFLNNLGKTTYANNDAALADGKKPGDIIALTNAPGGSSALAVVVEAVPAETAQYSFVPCTEHPEAGPIMYMSTEGYELLSGVLGGDPEYFFITDNGAESEFTYCYQPDPTYVPGTASVNIDVETILGIPTLTSYVDCAACEAAHPLP